MVLRPFLLQRTWKARYSHSTQQRLSTARDSWHGCAAPEQLRGRKDQISLHLFGGALRGAIETFLFENPKMFPAFYASPWLESGFRGAFLREKKKNDTLGLKFSCEVDFTSRLNSVPDFISRNLNLDCFPPSHPLAQWQRSPLLEDSRRHLSSGRTPCCPWALGKFP